jgi:CheY-like chemotaxis protein
MKFNGDGFWPSACSCNCDSETGPTGGIVNSATISIPATVLMVDDERQQLELRASVLRAYGFSVVTAPGPLEALSIAARLQNLNVAIIDYEMPTMNGGRLAEHLRTTLPKLKIILYSGAVSIPSDDLDHVDIFIPKGEGVAVLLRYLFTVPGAPTRTHVSSRTDRSDDPEEPSPQSRADPALLPAVCAVANAM